MTWTDSASSSAISPEAWFVGRTYFYLRDPEATLAAGYDRVKVFKRKNAFDPNWVEITKPETRLIIEPGKINYSFMENKAHKDAQYRPSLADSTGALPDVPQVNDIQHAIDSTYETLLTVQELKDLYCWGLLGLFQDDAGNPFPDRFYVHFIQYGITKFEVKTRLRVLPTRIVEAQDFTPREWDTFCTVQLDEFPVLSVEKVELTLPGAAPVAFPDDWVRLDAATGVLHILPGSAAPAGLMAMRPMGAMGKYLPQALRITYTAGFPLGRVPENIRDVIGKEASSGPLNLGGDLVGGAAVASQSMSLDGLSQSVNTTSSATNAGFGSRLIQYNNELKRDYPLIIGYYKGVRLYVG